jgi:hypothetical protein
MSCKEKILLLERHRKQVRAYADAVLRMRQQAATLSQDEFQLLWDLANRAFQLCDETRRRFEQHVADHGC